MARISGPVGPGARNREDDVLVVQLLLARHQRWLNGARVPPANSRFDAATEAAVKGFQTDGAALALADGIVTPDNFTFARLNLPMIVGPRHRIFRPVCQALAVNVLGGDMLTVADYEQAAKVLGCDAAAIKAVADTEARNDAWDLDNRPLVLFERHKFSKHTGGRYDRTHPDISSSRPRGYTKNEHDRLRRAAMLDEKAALKSASWGMFQIMGENHRLAGHPTVELFVSAMMRNRAEHLKAFVSFVMAQPPLREAIRQKKWPTFARLYNGPSYARQDYDGRIRRAYEYLSRAGQKTR